ncbi:AAA family ATPase [uncultured Flavonifractor sp.]|uniref:AAA family ATPase n=1 Tax=uncultured Flavonifractor sp. TaxID=1193534 RepID=UPI00174A8C08|nr:AAA family ATPase [uncultured Flavonifractor sp.]
MRRVLVLGCPGAGKSTLARSLGEALSLPVVHLDKLWWKSGWINRTEGEFDALLDTVLLGEEWVIDGNYLRTLPRRLERCDAVVLLDYPRQVCLFRALRRILSWRGRTRPDMAADCPERLDGEFVRWIWEFHRTQRPQVLELLDGWTGEKHVFRSPKDCARFLAKLEREGQTWRKF